MHCPLCRSQETRELETIDAKKLENLYSSLIGKSFGYLFTNDISEIRCENCGLIFFNPSITGDESFYNSLQKFDWYYMTDKEEYKTARKYIGNNDRVLDVGAGKGAFSKLLSTPNYVGLDLSFGAKEIGKANDVVIKNETIQEHASNHPEEYDVVCSFQVLEHVSNPSDFIQAKLRALKPNGLLIVAVPSEDSFLKYVVNGALNMPPHHVTRWSDITLQNIASLFNIDLIEINHEKIQNVHKIWYLNTLVQNSLLPPRLIDDRSIRKIVSGVASLSSRLLINGLKDDFLPCGHTVVCTYRKP